MTTEAPIPAINDVLVRSLFGRLPPPGASWPVEEQVAWLRAAVRVFGVVYEQADPPTIIYSAESEILKIGDREVALPARRTAVAA